MTIPVTQTETISAAKPPRSVAVAKADNKAPGAFRTISEVATELDVPQHVLRFWESKFSQIRPMKRGGGRRYYRPEDVNVIRQIQNLLYNQGYTIRGVQKLLKENRGVVINRISTATPAATQADSAVEKVGSLGLAVPAQPKVSGLTAKKREELEGLLIELKALRDLLRQSGI
jgi:DNA-binding transcriptional MerR regulator